MFVRLTEDTRTGAAGLSPDYASEGLRRLADAMQRDPESLQNADHARVAFVSAAHATENREPPIPPLPEGDPTDPGREPPLPPDSPYPGRPLQDPPVAPPGTPTQPPPEIIAGARGRLRKGFGNVARGT